jgi:16S rRNA (guanine966-N2)-methyltransferase
MRRHESELRILAGSLRGRLIRTLPGLATRPTKSLVRGALFDILGDRVEQARVIDLFAGAGVLGLEALSRGAEHAVFIDSNRRVLDLLKEQLGELLPAERYTCLRADALTLRSADLRPGPANLVLVDPPYDLWRDGTLAHRLIEQLSIWLAESALAPDVTVVLESDTPAALAHASRSFALEDQRQYGRTHLFLLSPRPSSASEPSQV